MADQPSAIWLGTPVSEDHEPDPVKIVEWAEYVERLAERAAISGGLPHEAVAVATTAAIVLSGEQVIDGEAQSAGARVLVKDQADPAENGFWNVAAGAWVRAADMDSAEDVQGAAAYVQGGAVNAGRTYGTTSEVSTLGADPVVFRIVYDNSGFEAELSAKLAAAANLGDLDSPSAARANIGLGAVDNTPDLDKPLSDPARLARDASLSPLREGAGNGRSAVRGFLDYWRDKAGNLVAGVERLTGRLAVADLGFLPDPRRTGPRYFGAAYDASGKVLSYYTRRGLLAITGGLFSDVRAGARSALRFPWSVSDRAGRVVIGIRPDGTTTLYPSPETRGNFYMAPREVGGDLRAFNVRRFGKRARIATVQDGDGKVFDVIQRDGKSVAVADDAAPLLLQLFYGQSNAGFSGGGDDSVPMVTDAIFPHHALAFEGLREGYRDTPSDPADYVDFEPLYDKPSKQQLAATMSAFGYEHARRFHDGRASPGVLSFFSWWGGKTVETFERGGIPWDNLMIGIDAAERVAGIYGRDIDCRVINWVQGEAGSDSGVEAYGPALVALSDDLRTEVAERLALLVEPEMVVWQINDNDDEPSDEGIWREQWLACNSTPGLTMGGPLYPYPLTDKIHTSALGRLMQGELVGEVNRRVIEDGSFTPLQMASAVLVGDTITVSFDVPAGALMFDDDWILPVPDYGFVFADDAASAGIASVTITGADEITITLDAVPSGANPKIQYAAYTADAVVDRWGNGRGLLYSPTEIPSLFHGLGYAVPETVRHYCVRCEINL
ncbi:hypothetical protein [Salipiger sp.]|uniref:hypothetical protein n=1 Tax=Salipiger sp. TaxID=2078585 RepID=UPI003A98051A